MKFIPDAIGRKIAQQRLLASKNSPKILFGAGVIGMVGSTLLACRATLKLDEVLETAQRDMHIANAMEHETYSETDRKKDKAIILTRGIGNVAKLYAPSVLLGAASIGCLTKSHNLLQERNLALTAAYAVVDGAFNRYRERVIDRYGEEVDRNLRYESEAVDIIDEETGKLIATSNVIDGPGSAYARFFDKESSSSWSRDPGVNIYFLRSSQTYCNDRLRARGHIFLNEVYDELGLCHTAAGAVVGWRWNKDSGDDCVDFGIWDDTYNDVNNFFNGREGSILLDFNVDGVIYDKLEEIERG